MVRPRLKRLNMIQAKMLNANMAAELHLKEGVDVLWSPRSADPPLSSSAWPLPSKNQQEYKTRWPTWTRHANRFGRRMRNTLHEEERNFRLRLLAWTVDVWRRPVTAVGSLSKPVREERNQSERRPEVEPKMARKFTMLQFTMLQWPVGIIVSEIKKYNQVNKIFKSQPKQWSGTFHGFQTRFIRIWGEENKK